MARSLKPNRQVRRKRTRSPRRRAVAKRKIGRKLLLALVAGWLIVLGVQHHHQITGALQRLPAAIRPAEPGPVAESPAVSNVKVTNPAKTTAAREKEPAETVQADNQPGNGGEIDNEQETPGFAESAWNPKNWFDKLFTVGEIEIRGAYSIHRDTLRSLLGELEGRPMLKLDVAELAGRLQQHPRVKEAAICRRLPRTLVAEVCERREVAQVIVKGVPIGVDGEGVILSDPRPGWPVDVPVITGFGKQLEPGERVEDQGLIEALSWVRSSGSRPRVHRWISELHLDESRVAWIDGSAGNRLRPGRHKVIAQVSALDAFLADSTAWKISGKLLDLRFPSFLILKDNQQG